MTRNYSFLSLTNAILFFIAVSAVLFRNNSYIFNGLDGSYLLTIARAQFDWTPAAFGLSSNPLQGMADIWFNFNAWLHPGYVIPYVILGKPESLGVEYRVVVYATHALLLFISSMLLVRRFDFPLGLSIIGSWLVVALVFPVVGNSLVYPILGLQPNVAMTIALYQFIMAAFVQVGRITPHRQHAPLQHLGLIIGIILLSGILLLAGPGSIFFVVPYIFIALASMISAESRAEIIWKFAAILVVPAILVSVGFAHFGLGIFKFTVPYFFPEELTSSRATWYFVSILFHDEVHGPGGPLLAGLGIAGLVFGAWANNRRLAWLARGSLLFVVVNIALGSATVLFDYWHGPSPVYFEAMLWPIYALFSVRLVFLLPVRIGQFFSSTLAHKITRIGERINPMILGGVISIVVIVLSFSFPPVPENSPVFPYPQSKPELVEILQDEIGLSLNAPLRGRVVVMPLQNVDEPVSWPEIHTSDGRRSISSGNDLNTIGLWQHGIPTFFEYAPTISPTLFMTATRLLARPEDPQMRSVLVLRKVNSRAFAALGITHVIADAPLPAPLELIHTEELEKGVKTYLYRVPGAITGWASPTKAITSASLDEAIDRLDDVDFDPMNEVIILQEGMPPALPVELTAAQNVHVQMVRGGFKVSAVSASRSLVVVPVLYSRCLSFEAVSVENSNVALKRVNALETGIEFSGNLHGTLRYFTGPFQNPSCRLQDAHDLAQVLGLDNGHASNTANGGGQ